MEGSKTSFRSSKFPWAPERINFDIYKQFEHDAPSERFARPNLQ